MHPFRVVLHVPSAVAGIWMLCIRVPGRVASCVCVSVVIVAGASLRANGHNYLAVPLA